MHFSRPSGCWFSWCRPWYRGCGGTFCSGYSSVTTSRNISLNVTPKPATEAKNPGCPSRSATVNLLVVLGPAGRRGVRPGTDGRDLRGQDRSGRPADRLAGHRRDRVSTFEGVDLGRG